jgi:putative peptide zinc metalloprotease protein
MTSTLFSSDWYRIAELKPKLREHVTVHEHRYRGKRWYLLEDHITGQIRKISPESYLLVGLMNGKRTVDELWEISSQRLAEHMPTHEELLQLLTSLYQGNVIKMDVSGDVAELFEREEEAKRKRWISKLRSPLSVQIPLIDPENFVTKTQHWIKPLFTKWFGLVWLLLVFNMLFMVGQHWDEMSKSVSDKMLAADNLFLLWLIYPIIKLFHEFGHAYAVKRGGGAVHELGFMLLVLIPVPYVDASSSSAFANKKDRMLVGAAGIMVELFFAAIATIVWVNAEPGLVKSIAYNVIFIAGISTVFVNGNPLLKFDGYYVFSDYLEIPNLAQRANQYWGWLFKRVVFGVKGYQSPAYDKKEASWLCLYGVAALIYRFFLMISIFLFVAQQYFVIGVILAVWSIMGTWVIPNLKLLAKPWQDGDIQAGTRNPTLMISLIVGAVIFLFAVIPFPLTTSVEGVVLFTKERRMVIPESCFVDELNKTTGDSVKKGELILRCENKQIKARREILTQQLNEFQSKRLGVWEDPVAIKIFDEELNRLQKELEENAVQLGKLEVIAKTDGVWWQSRPDVHKELFYKRGELLGYIIDTNKIKIRAMIPEPDIRFIRDKTEDVVVRFPANFAREYSIKEWHVFPSTSKDIVSPVLTENGGGTIVVNPSAEKPESIQPYFYIDLELDQLDSPHQEERVYVKFIHPSEVMIFRIYRLVRRTFLEYFDV